MSKSDTDAEKVASSFKEYCKGKNYQIKQSEEPNSIRLEISNFSERTIVQIYYTGSLQVQGKQNSLKAEMEEIKNKFGRQSLIDIVDKPSKTNACRASYDIMLQDIRDEIKEILSKIGGNVYIVDNPHSSTAYRAKITRDSLSITLTQYNNGTLFLQGKTDQIFDEVCDHVEKIANPTEGSVIARFISSDEKCLQIFADRYSPQLIDSAEESVRKKTGDVFEYLEVYDKKWFVASECLCLTKIPLPEFSPLVMPASKAFEGFAKKLLVDIGLFEKNHFTTKKASFSNLNDPNNPKRKDICDKEKYAETMLKKISLCLDMNRNFMMHSDSSQITKIDNYESAEKKVNGIFSDVNELFEYFRAIYNLTI